MLRALYSVLNRHPPTIRNPGVAGCLHLYQFMVESGIAHYEGIDLAKESFQVFIARLSRASGMGHAQALLELPVRGVAKTIAWSLVAPIAQSKWSKMFNFVYGTELRTCDILLLSFELSHSRVLLPIAQEILGHREYRPVLLRSSMGRRLHISEMRRVAATGVPLGFLDAYVGAREYRGYVHCAFELAQRYRRLLQSQRGQIRNLTEVMDLPPGFLEWALGEFFLRDMPLTYSFWLASDRIFRNPIRMVVLGNDFCNRGRTMIAQARLRGIPTLTIQHGVVGDPGYYLPAADRMVVWGERDRAILARAGADNSRLLVLGSPVHDVTRSDNTLTRLPPARVRGNKKVVFASTVGLPRNFVLRAIDLLLRALADVPDLQLVVKPHPLEDIGCWRRLAKTHSEPQFAVTSTEIRHLAEESLIGAVVFSTVALDLILRGIPVAVLDCEGYRDVTGMSKYRAMRKVHSAAELAAFISEVRDDDDFWPDFEKRRSQLLKDYLGHPASSPNAEIYATITEAIQCGFGNS